MSESKTEKGSTAILDQYVQGAPDDQKALDIFAGEWSSAMPPGHSGLAAGHAALFEDPRLQWGMEQLGGVEGARVLELGPLEGGHSYMLESAGADAILAVESNTRAYLKCLIVKEIMGLQRCRFLLGDFLEYLRESGERFDLCVASGVLYHMDDPMELLRLIANSTDRAFLWTHYFDAKVIESNRELAHKFVGSERRDADGFAYRVHRQLYKAALGWQGFCGGSAPHSHWLTREDILGGLGHYGFTDVRTGFEQPDHPNGPAFCVSAAR